MELARSSAGAVFQNNDNHNSDWISINLKIPLKFKKNIIYTVFFLFTGLNSGGVIYLFSSNNKESPSVINKEITEDQVDYNECNVGRNTQLEINYIKTDKNNCLKLKKGDKVILQFVDDTDYNAQIECFVIDDDAPENSKSDAVFCVSNETLERFGIREDDKRGLYKMKIRIIKNQHEN